ncbi:MBL fold metallo-hydrolase [Peribacillus sp. NPDC058002]|uniref:MBL fold metallo-hydrolase n=1 Tax=Peribacillus sp. NPDC058002 TaxID=3346301 RepID=UPI0036DDAE54
MKWKQIPLGPLQTNCYVVSDGQDCIIFDPGEEPHKIIQYIQTKNLKPLAILLTHAHFDHIGALDAIRDHYGIPAYIHEKEAKWLLDPALNGSQNWFPESPMRMKPADHILANEQELTIGGFTFEVLETPGHSPGSVSYYVKEERFLFSGDVLFQGSVGRTDLIGGSEAVLLNSIETKLLTLSDDAIVFPGHGPVTTIMDEKNTNPFLK